MSRPISTQDIELAAAYMTATGEQPEIIFEDGAKLVTFGLPSNDITINLLNRYATGELSLNIKRFTSCRNFLFKKLKGVR